MVLFVRPTDLRSSLTDPTSFFFSSKMEMVTSGRFSRSKALQEKTFTRELTYKEEKEGNQ